RTVAKLTLALHGSADTTWNPEFSLEHLLGGGFVGIVGTNLYLWDYESLTRVTTEATDDVDESWRPPIWVPSPDAGNTLEALQIEQSYLYAHGIFTNSSGELLTNIVRLDLGGRGEMDPSWTFPWDSAASRLGLPYFDFYLPYYGGFLASGRDVHLGYQTLAFFPVADAPVMVKLLGTNFAILRNAEDGYEVTHFRITGVTGGVLYQS